MEAELADEFGVAPGLLRVHSVDQRVLALRVGPVVAEFAKLLVAAGGVVARIEDQHYILAAQRRERNDFAVLIGHEKSGAGVPGRRGSGKEPVEQELSREGRTGPFIVKLFLRRFDVEAVAEAAHAADESGPVDRARSSAAGAARRRRRCGRSRRGRGPTPRRATVRG